MEVCTYLLISLLLPLRNQVRVRVAVLQKPVVQLLRDCFLFVVELVDVARACTEYKQISGYPSFLPLKPPSPSLLLLMYRRLYVGDVRW